MVSGDQNLDQHRDDWLIENYYDLLEAGESRWTACERLGVKWNTLERIMHRRAQRSA